jgi:hypothetical protein
MSKFLFSRKERVIKISYNELITDLFFKAKITDYPRESGFADKELAVIGLEYDIINRKSEVVLQEI